MSINHKEQSLKSFWLQAATAYFFNPPVSLSLQDGRNVTLPEISGIGTNDCALHFQAAGGEKISSPYPLPDDSDLLTDDGVRRITDLTEQIRKGISVRDELVEIVDAFSRSEHPREDYPPLQERINALMADFLGGDVPFIVNSLR